jgi:cytochrome P450
MIQHVNAVDERVRFDGPVQFIPRRAAERIVLNGETIPSGSLVLGVVGATNRAPAEFDEPDRLWLAGPNAMRHLGFGKGIHICVGADLARLPIEVALESLLRRCSNWTLDGSPMRDMRVTLRVLTSLPVSIKCGSLIDQPSR